MSVLNPRNRLVYFRVSEDEYRRYSNLCESTGSRSISELARSAMQSMVQNSASREDHVPEKLALLESLVKDLNRKVNEISLSLGRPASQDAESEQNDLSTQG